MRPILTSLCAVTLLLACSGPKKAPQQLADIVIPDPPAMLMKPQDMMTQEDYDRVQRYMAEHYWDNMPFTDTAYINKEVTLQAFSNYAYMLNNIPLPLAKESVSLTMDRAKADSAMYAYFAKMAYDHFYQAESFYYRNDDIYASVLENIIAWDGADELHKIGPRAQLATIMRNRVGDPANDFAFTLENGETKNLYDIRAPYTLLYFNQPLCPICEQLTEGLTTSALLERLVGSGRLKVVAVYPEGNIPLWREHLADFPDAWIQGYAIGMRDDDLYDIRAIPALYLLDENKNVLIKDGAYAAQIERYFEEL